MAERTLPSARRIITALLLVATLVTGGIQLGIFGGSGGSIDLGPGVTLPTGDGALIEGVLGLPRSPYPLFAETGADRALVTLTYRGLTRLNERNWPTPDLATEWSSFDSGKAWNFTLDPAARWDDGTPVSINDVLVTVGVASELNTAGGYWNSITIEAGEREGALIARSPRALANLPAMFATLPLLPAHIYSGLAASDVLTTALSEPPHGTGPFTIDALAQNAASLSRRTDLLLASDTAIIERSTGIGQEVTAIGLRFFGDAGAALGAWNGGSLDLLAGIEHAAATESVGTRGRLIDLGSTVFTGIATNLRPGEVLRDPNIRVALAALLDPAAIVDTYGGVVARTPVPPGSWAWTSTKELSTGTAFATAKLKRAKWTIANGIWYFPSKKPARLEILSLPAMAFPADAAIAAQAAAAWNSFGIETTVTELTADDLTARIAQGEFRLAVVNIEIGSDPDLYPLYGSGAVLTGGNISAIQLKRLDDLLSAARVPAPLEKRQAAMAAVQRWCAANVYTLPIRFAATELLASSRVSGVEPILVEQPETHLRAVLSFRLVAP
ncbi:MAG: hypothetical protein RIT06_687 [Chloroflexota bacterium]|jgi:peptide/nickel transport system substrate-binding protein